MEISNIGVYNDRMAKSIVDKLFFIPYLNDVETLVDFGCANGELFKYCPQNWKMIGIDDNPEMMKAAKENYPAGEYVRTFDDLPNIEYSKTALNLSSVIHEVYSYLPVQEIVEFWQNVFTKGFEYICIRDMAIDPEANTHWNIDNVFKIKENPNGYLFDDYRKNFTECRERELIHFLLKYKYIENWEREKKENYFPLTNAELISLVPDEYEIIFCDKFILEYTRNQIKKDFDYDVKYNTHIKLILKRKEH